MVWRYDDDFGWYDADDVLGNVPTGPTVIPGTDVQRNIGGDYHPDVVMPDPIITMATAAALGPAIAAGGGASNATTSFLAALNAAQTDEVATSEPEPELQPGPEEGDTRTDATGTYKYINGAWQKQETEVPDPEPDAAIAAEIAAAAIEKAILDAISKGQAVAASELEKIRDPDARTKAATQLAKNMVTTLGNTQQTADLIRGLFGTYFDKPGTPFGSWAESVGFTWTEQGGVPGMDVATDTTVTTDGTTVTGDPGAATFVDFLKIPDAYTGAFDTVDEYNKWYNAGMPDKSEIDAILGITGTDAAIVTPPTNVAGVTPGVTTPAAPGVLAGMQSPQEAFPQDVFRRFLASQAAPLSPYMQRGAQSLYPQLSAEYGFLPYMPGSSGMMADPTTAPTFASWLESGQRPTRENLFGTLKDIGSVLSGGPGGTIAEGLSPSEMARRGAIQAAFGTETPESRQQLQQMLSGAFMKDMAPAFRYPIQAGIQNVFETQRALQPDKPFLSFLGERL